METLKQRDVKKSRKEHQCDGCLEIIPVGSPYSYWAGILDGEFTQSYLCKPCLDYIHRNFEYEDYENGFARGQIGWARKEEEQYLKSEVGA